MSPQKTKHNHARNQEQRQQDAKRQYRLGDHGTENVTRCSLLFYRVLPALPQSECVDCRQGGQPKQKPV